MKLPSGKYLTEINERIRKGTSELHELRIISKATKDIIETYKTAYPESDLSNFYEIATIYDIRTLLIISILDLSVIQKLTVVSTEHWEKIYLFRKGYLTINETLKVYRKKSKYIKELVRKYHNNTEEFDSINLSIRAFEKTFELDRIRYIRDNVSGHIIENLDTFYDIIYQIEPHKALMAIQSYLKIQYNLYVFLKNLETDKSKRLDEKIEHQKSEIESKTANLERMLDLTRSMKPTNIEIIEKIESILNKE